MGREEEAGMMNKVQMKLKQMDLVCLTMYTFRN